MAAESRVASNPALWASWRIERVSVCLRAIVHDLEFYDLSAMGRAALAAVAASSSPRMVGFVMSDRLPITFTLEGEAVESVTRLVRSGPYVLVLQTVLPQRGLAVELHSTFVGHAGARTRATHLLLGPIGQPPRILTREDELGVIDPVCRPDSCLYAHCHELIDLLAEHGLRVMVERFPAQPVGLSV